MGKTKSNEEVIDGLFNEFFKFTNRYPLLVKYFRQMRTISDWMRLTRGHINKISRTFSYKIIEIDEAEIAANLNSILDTFRKIEERIKKEEDDLIANGELDKNTNYFYIEDVIKEINGMESNVNKMKYLKYLKSEYPRHLLRRENLMNDELNKLIVSNPNYITDIFQNYLHLIESKVSKQPNKSLITFPIPDFTFEEQINQKIEYYMAVLKIEKKYKVPQEESNKDNKSPIKSPVKYIGKIPDLVRIFESMKESFLIETELEPNQITEMFFKDKNSNKSYSYNNTKISNKIRKSQTQEYFDFVLRCTNYIPKSKLQDLLNHVKDIAYGKSR